MQSTRDHCLNIISVRVYLLIASLSALQFQFSRLFLRNFFCLLNSDWLCFGCQFGVEVKINSRWFSPQVALNMCSGFTARPETPHRHFWSFLHNFCDRPKPVSGLQFFCCALAIRKNRKGTSAFCQKIAFGWNLSRFNIQYNLMRPRTKMLIRPD